MRIVITGASGNVGTALLRRLTATGKHDLVGVVRRRPDDVEPYAAVEWSTLDLSRDDDPIALRAILAGADAVVHLAWGFQPSHDLAFLEELGVGGTRRVLDALGSAPVFRRAPRVSPSSSSVPSAVRSSTSSTSAPAML